MDKHGPQVPDNDLGEFSTRSFDKVNQKAGGFDGGAPDRELGRSDMPPAGETDGDAALAKVGGMASRGRSDATSSAPAKLPTEAGGPLPQDTPTGT